MNPETEEKLARSLTAETKELIPFLPYLLQDLWQLGSSPEVITKLIKKQIPITSNTMVLDLACGKGAVAVKVAKALNIHVNGFDIIEDFVRFAEAKAKELYVDALCRFKQGDANDVVENESNYDCVIFGAAGNILGDPQETLDKLAKTVKPNSYIIIDEAYAADESVNEKIKYKSYDYLTRKQWTKLFEKAGLRLVEEVKESDSDYDFDADNKAIAARAGELIEKYPDKREMFEGYVRSQLAECEDIENNLVAVTWMLKKM